jgi:hypothetical protein
MLGMELGLLVRIERDLRALCGGLDPDAVTVPEVAASFEALDRIARLAAGAKVRLARRLDDADVARAGGARDTVEFLARATGTSVVAARDTLLTSRRLADQPATDAAVAAGRLSEVQATVVADAAAADPAAVRGLVDTAERSSMRDLRAVCARTKANAHPDAAARREAIRRSRSCRTWVDLEGAWNLSLRHLPEVGAEIEALLAPFTHARHEAARTVGTREPRDAYRADAVLDLARASRAGGTATPKGARQAETKVFVHVDLATLQAGSTRPGSTCHVDGLGPVDVEHVRSLLGEAFVVALIQDGVDVRRVVHLGRRVTAHQRSALEARGQRCEVPGCDVTWGLEIDHVTGWALTGTTRIDDLAWICHHHHDRKTHRGYRLTGPPGHRRWTPPLGPRSDQEQLADAETHDEQGPEPVHQVLSLAHPVRRRPVAVEDGDGDDGREPVQHVQLGRLQVLDVHEDHAEGHLHEHEHLGRHDRPPEGRVTEGGSGVGGEAPPAGRGVGPHQHPGARLVQLPPAHPAGEPPATS